VPENTSTEPGAVRQGAGPDSDGRPPGGRRGRRRSAAVAMLLSGSLLAACGGGDDGPPTLNWYINAADSQNDIAAACTEAAEGRYRITTSVLPRLANQQREQLVRRLAAEDRSIDIMSLDPVFVAEFSEAGFLAEVPDEVRDRATEGVVPSLVQASTWRDEVVGIPFWANTQLLWYRKSVAEAAGLDMTQPVTWDQLIEAAQSQSVTIAVQGARAESLTVWVNALVESAGGSILENPEAPPDEVEVGLAGEAGQRAAEVMAAVANSGVTPPAVSTADEPTNAVSFYGDNGGFMVNWPFIYAFTQAAIDAGTVEPAVLDDIGWAQYPQVDEGEESAPPLGGIVLGVGAYSENVDLAFEASECITNAENQALYAVNEGNPPARVEVYDDPSLAEDFPFGDAIVQSLENAAPRPQTPYYNEVTGSVQRLFHPPASVQPERTPQETSELIQAVLRKEQLL
jgi:multiple sugar transport system substrate-binding protein